MGLEILGAGIGLAFVGAVYLGLSFLDTVPGIANRLFLHARDLDSNEVGLEEPVYYQQVYDASEQVLRARLGILYLSVGFLLQLIGVLLPSDRRPVIVLIVVALVVIIAVLAGNTWLRSHMSTMIKAILSSHTIDQIGDRAPYLRRNNRVNWEESWLLRALRVVFSGGVAFGRRTTEDDELRAEY